MESVVTMHADNPYGEGHPAINVKWYGLWLEGDWPDADLEVVYEVIQEDWWYRAAQIAWRHGYSGVFAEGRMGGWLLPYRQETKGGSRYFTAGGWPGQGGDHGYPTYPDMADAEERGRFLAFREEIETLLEEVPEMLREELDYQQAEAEVRKGLADPLAAYAAADA